MTAVIIINKIRSSFVSFLHCLGTKKLEIIGTFWRVPHSPMSNFPGILMLVSKRGLGWDSGHSLLGCGSTSLQAASRL